MDSKNGHKGTKNYSNTWICAIAKIGGYAYFFVNRHILAVWLRRFAPIEYIE